MRYWLWLAVKLAAIGIVVLGFWLIILSLLPRHPGGLLTNWPRLGVDLGYTLAVFLLGLSAAGLLAACAWDQRYRCRTCGRRLRMPSASGVLSSVMLGGMPNTEYICTFGHGKLEVPDVHTSYRPAKWTRYESIWDDWRRAEQRTKR